MVTIHKRVDYEQVQELKFSVVVRDTGIPQLSAVALVTATVTNINDNDPTFSQVRLHSYLLVYCFFIYLLISSYNSGPKLCFMFSTMSESQHIRKITRENDNLVLNTRSKSTRCCGCDDAPCGSVLSASSSFRWRKHKAISPKILQLTFIVRNSVTKCTFCVISP